MTEDRTPPAWAGRLFIAAAAVGVMIGYRNFVKIRIGPIYSLEIIFLLWAACVLWTPFRRWPATYGRLSYPTLLFAAWGSVLLLRDLTIYHAGASSIAFSSIAQHAILICYPVMWTLAGYWCFVTDRLFTRILALALMVCNALPNLQGTNVTNIAAGPLLAIPFVFLLHRSRWQRGNFLVAMSRYACILVLAFFTFLPFWRMWITAMQRTSFLILINTLIVAPWLFKSKGESSWRCVRTSALAIGMFIVGLAAYFTWLKHAPDFYEQKSLVPAIVSQIKSFKDKPALQAAATTVTLFRHDTCRSFLHGEDRRGSTNVGVPVMRTRRYMWESTLNEWRSHPVIGIGFIPEVPRDVSPGMPNNGGFEHWDAPPVNGPHNSYLSILARMGIIGSLLFLWIGIRFSRQAWVVYHVNKPLDLFQSLIILVPINGAIHALVNVGLESPPRAMLMWLFIGMLTADYGSCTAEPCEF